MKFRGIVFQNNQPKDTTLLWIKGGVSSLDSALDEDSEKPFDMYIFNNGKWESIHMNMADTIGKAFKEVNRYFELIIKAIDGLNQESGRVSNKLDELIERISKLEETKE